MKIKNVLTILFLSTTALVFSQEKSFKWNNDSHKDDVVMSWTKDTPDQEMKDDCKALSEKGISIKYSNVKRNSNKEITGIRVEYSDRKGNKGSMELNNQKPITNIYFFKQGDQIGFGQPTGMYNRFAGNPFFNQPFNDMMQPFNFNEGGNDMQSFDFTFPDENGIGQSKSKIIIKKDGKKPLVIEDGNVIEGGEDYTPEEIEKIKKENQTKIFQDNSIPFHFGPGTKGFENLNEQMKKMQEQIDQLMKDSKTEKEESSPEKKPESDKKAPSTPSTQPEKTKTTLKIQKT